VGCKVPGAFEKTHGLDITQSSMQLNDLIFNWEDN
jgi:hypothetical protein